MDPRSTRLDEAQGADEERSEPYNEYGERAPELATPRFAKNIPAKSGFARLGRDVVRKPGRPFAVFDIDGTIIRWQLFHAIIDALAKHQELSPETYEQVRSARMAWKTRTHEESFSEYERQLVHMFQTMLKGLEVDVYTVASREVFKEYKDQVYRYTRGLIQELKKENYLLFAISGSPAEAVTPFAEYYGFDDFVASTYEKEGNHYTGHVNLTIGQKDKLLKGLAEKHGATFKASIGVGDSEGDISMLEFTDRPIAFNPSKKLFQHAQTNRWEIVVERKNVVYELRNQNNRYVLAETDRA